MPAHRALTDKQESEFIEVMRDKKLRELAEKFKISISSACRYKTKLLSKN